MITLRLTSLHLAWCQKPPGVSVAEVTGGEVNFLESLTAWGPFLRRPLAWAYFCGSCRQSQCMHGTVKLLDCVQLYGSWSRNPMLYVYLYTKIHNSGFSMQQQHSMFKVNDGCVIILKKDGEFVHVYVSNLINPIVLIHHYSSLKSCVFSRFTHHLKIILFPIVLSSYNLNQYTLFMNL